VTLKIFSNWFELNKLSLNRSINKTNVMLFSSKYKKIYQLKYYNSRYCYSGVENKFLGMILNQSLSWNDHILFIKQKLMYSIGIIVRMRYHLLRHVLLSLYKTLIHPCFRWYQPQSSRVAGIAAYLFNTVSGNKPISISTCLVGFYGHFKSPHSFHISSRAHLYIIVIV